MKKIKNAAVAMALSLMVSTTCFAATETDAEFDVKANNGTIYAYSVSSVLTGESESPEDYDFSFEDEVEVNGVQYQLDHIEFEVNNLYAKEYGDTEIAYTIEDKETVKSEDKEEYKTSKKTLEENGFTYSYKDTKFEVADKKEPIEMSCYEDSDITMGTIDSVTIKESKEYEYNGKTYELPYSRYEVINQGWHDNYKLTGTITGYDAPTYKVGNMVIEPSQLANLSKEQLQSLVSSFGYDPAHYKVLSLQYTGEPYMNGDKLCRDYSVSVSIYGCQYRIYYEDKIDESTYEAINTYELSGSDMELLDNLKGSYEVEGKAFYNEVTKSEKKKLTTTQKVALAFGIIVGLALLVALFLYILRGGRKDTDYRSRRDSKRDLKNLRK